MTLSARTHLTRSSTRERIAIRRGRTMAAAAAACGFALGMLVEFFADPRAGRRRRHTTRDRALSRVRRGERLAMMRARRAESHAVGIARRTFKARRGHREPLDDVTLARKVESELGRRANLPRGHVVVNTEDGVVFLRGVLDRQEDIERAEAATRKISGVRAVENLLHLAGTPAPPSRAKLVREQSGDGERRRVREAR